MKWNCFRHPRHKYVPVLAIAALLLSAATVDAFYWLDMPGSGVPPQPALRSSAAPLPVINTAANDPTLNITTPIPTTNPWTPDTQSTNPTSPTGSTNWTDPKTPPEVPEPGTLLAGLIGISLVSCARMVFGKKPKPVILH